MEAAILLKVIGQGHYIENFWFSLKSISTIISFQNTFIVYFWYQLLGKRLNFIETSIGDQFHRRIPIMTFLLTITHWLERWTKCENINVLYVLSSQSAGLWVGEAQYSILTRHVWPCTWDTTTSKRHLSSLLLTNFMTTCTHILSDAQNTYIVATDWGLVRNGTKRFSENYLVLLIRTP